MAKFQKGNPGKPKGAKNKIPASLAGKVLHACEHLENIGKSLTTLAEEKPQWFFETFVKAMLPKDLQLRVIKSLDDLTDEEKITLAKSLVGGEPSQDSE